MTLLRCIDRFMCECRALSKGIGNAGAAVRVARREGALDHDRLTAALDRRPLPVAAATDPAVRPGDRGVLAVD